MPKPSPYLLRWSPAGQRYELCETRVQTLIDLEAESSGWFVWVGRVSSFAFHGRNGSFTARRERVEHSDGYWYAYARAQGKVTKRYLGRGADLTLARLEQAGHSLSAKSSGVALAEERSEGHHTSPLRSSVVRQEGSPSRHETPAGDMRRREPLLMIKIRPPGPRPGTVYPTRLVARLCECAGGACTVVSAPAGFGKTTLLSSWIAATETPVAWVSLEQGDNEPVRFLTYVIAALQTIDASIGADALTLLSAPQLTRYESVLALLTNDLLSHATADFALVLDDYHVIISPSIHYLLAYLVERLPPQMSLVIATRADPSLPLARLRARGQLTEVRAADLRFDAEETDTFLRSVMRLNLTSDDVALLQGRTEGWIAGLQFAALSLRGREDNAAFLQAFTGSHRFVLDYLSEEVFSQQSQSVQDFLLQTCLLERLSGPLCNALTGHDNGQAMLECLERENMFVIPLDDERQWFRYHHLFADVLRNVLRQTQPARTPTLHLLASSWYEQHGMVVEAVGHALAAPDYDVAARLIDQYAFEVGGRGHYYTVLGWLEALPEPLVRAHARLSLLYALVLRATNQLDAAEVRLQDAERCIQSDMPPEQMRPIMGRVAVTRAALALCRGDLMRCVGLARQALDLLPPTMDYMREIATAQLTYEYLITGDVTPATVQPMEQLIALARTSPNRSTTVRTLANLAHAQALQGRLTKSISTYDAVTHAAPTYQAFMTIAGSPAYHFGLGDLLRERHDLAGAERLIAEGMELLEGAVTVDADVVTMGHIALARLKQSHSDYSGAAEVLKRYSELAASRGFAPYLLEQAAAFQARLALAQGNLAAAIHWAEARRSLAHRELTFQYESEYLTLARVWIAQARHNQIESALSAASDALKLLDPLLREAEIRARMGSVIEILLVRALAHHARSDDASALADLVRALELGEPEGYFRLFLDEGAPMMALLRLARAHGLALDYVARLLAATEARTPLASPGAVPDTPRFAALPEPLSARELEVLRLLAQGDSNVEIAQRLVIAVSTAKRHVSNIFAKLTVSNRTQAVARARDVGLL